MLTLAWQLAARAFKLQLKIYGPSGEITKMNKIYNTFRCELFLEYGLTCSQINDVSSRSKRTAVFRSVLRQSPNSVQRGK
jgi:hypothetical protein